WSTEGAVTNQPRAKRSAALGLIGSESSSPERAKPRPMSRPFRAVSVTTRLTQGGASLCPGLFCRPTFGAECDVSLFLLPRLNAPFPRPKLPDKPPELPKRLHLAHPPIDGR